ncbi:MAG: hypothetical protein H6R14_449 [Proteobacteria bacterium]|nr:hypothetical protein [Pseudomonadota bacterium]
MRTLKLIARYSLLFAGLLVGGTAGADNVYRSVGPDGRVTYSDHPPTTGKVQKIYSFENLPASPVPESTLNFRQDAEKSMKKRLAAQPASGTVLYSAEWCGYCRKAKAYLNNRGVAYQEIDIDTPDGKQAFSAVGRGGGIPLLIANGQRVQGFTAAAYDALFSR